MDKFYRNLFKRSWKISWRYKWLWIFGFFATFLGNGTFYESVIRSFTNMSEGRSIFYTLRQYSSSSLFNVFSWTKLMDILQQDTSAFTLAIFSLLVVFVIFVAFLILAIVSQVGLIKSAVNFDQNKKINFRQAFSAGIEKFWPVLGLNFFMRAVLMGLVLAIALIVSLIAYGSALLASLLYIIAVVLLLVIAIIIYFLIIYSTAYIVLRQKKVFESIKAAWQLFRKNILLNLEIGFIVFIINMLVGVIAVIASVFILSPFILLYLLMVLMSINAGLGILGVIIIILFGSILILTGAWFTTFYVNVWSLLFEELELKGGKSKLFRLYERMRGRKVAKKKA